jgi:outer membrane protein OmpA-like peptidoglycan-associated protein
MGFVFGVSVVLILPQRVLAQAGGAEDAASSSGTASSAPPTGSHLHQEPRGEATAVPQSGTVSRPAIHVEMAQTARGRRKPVKSSPPAATAFKPASIKPLPEVGAENVAAHEPSAEQAAETSRLPETMPAPTVAEPALSQEAAVARRPSRTAGGAMSGEATPGNATERVVRENEAKSGDQQAALPPASAPSQPSAIAQLAFAPETATLSAEAKTMLKDLAARFPAHDENMRLQLMAYASGEGMSASKARRLSLARALSVREYLIANGIEGTRMDVRALGDEAGGSPAGSPANRVDIAMIKR